MRVFKDLKRIMVAGSVVLFAFFSSVAGIAVAAEEDAPDYRIQVSPAKLSLDLKPGETTTATFKVQNTGKKTFDFNLSTGPYSVKGEDYQNDFSTVTGYNHIKDWISFSRDKGTLDADKEEQITVTVSVPEDVPEGGQYAVIFARMIEPDEDEKVGGIKPQSQVGLLIYSKNVAGNTREEGSVIENKIPSFLFVPPVQTTSVVKNTGNVHATASYTLQVYPFFGGEEVYTNEENPTTLTVLPETSRFNQMEWEGAPQLGVFKVKQTVKFLDDTSVVEKVVFICPLWFLFIVLAIIFLAVFWIVGRVHGRRKETNHD